MLSVWAMEREITDVARELGALLERAAQLAAARNMQPDDFMAAAWAACLEARPGLREQLEEAQTLARLESLRERGLIAEA